jgi:hypothetical protein
MGMSLSVSEPNRADFSCRRLALANNCKSYVCLHQLVASMETEVLLADDVPELTVRDTNKATLSFSDARLIGREHNYATVYRVVLPGGMAAAAKRLDRADALRLLGRHRRRVMRRPRESQKRERRAFDRPRVGPMMWAQDGWVSRGRVIKTLQF